MTAEESTPEERPAPLAWAGWILTALLLAYAALLHRGIGPIPANLESNWYNPNKFLLDGILASRAGAAMESVGSALALLALPALATAVAVFFTTRSAVARMLSTSSAIAVAIFVYYGVQAPGVWSFFHWRWSGCVLLFAISPWPVVQVFGLEVFASIIAVLLVGVAIGLWVVSRGLSRAPGDLIALSVAAALAVVAIPTFALWLGANQGLLPFRAAPGLLIFTAAIALATFAIAGKLSATRRSFTVAGRARMWALGGLLLGLPLFVGQTLTLLDYTTTRDGRAQQVIVALQRDYD